jgi:hypothetical protein
MPLSPPPPSYSSYGGTAPYSPSSYQPSYQPLAPTYSPSPIYPAPSPLPPPPPPAYPTSPSYPTLTIPSTYPVPPPSTYQPIQSPQIYQPSQQSSTYPLPPMPSAIIYANSPLSSPSTSSNLLSQVSLPNEYPQIIGNKIVGTTTPSLYQGLDKPLNSQFKGGINSINGGLSESLGRYINFNIKYF